MHVVRVCPLVAAIVAVLAMAGCGREMTTDAVAAGGVDPATVTVRPRDFVRRVRLTGLTEAIRSYVVTTPLLTGASRGSS